MFERFMYGRNLKKLNKDLKKLCKVKNKDDAYRISQRMEKRVEKCISLLDRFYLFDDSKSALERKFLTDYTSLAPLIIRLKEGKISNENYKTEVEKLFF